MSAAGWLAEAKKARRGRLHQFASIVMPQTLRSWHRRLIARKHDGSARRSLGGPHTPGEIRELILTMARQNRGWGYTRVQCGAGEPHST